MTTSSSFVDLAVVPAVPARPRRARALDDVAIRAQRGEPGAADELMERLLVQLRPLVRHRLRNRSAGVLSESDLDDVMQDVALLIWQNDLRRFDPRRSGFLTFVSRRLTWHLADRAREVRRSTWEELDNEAAETTPAPGADAESLIDAMASEKLTESLPRRMDAAGVDDQARLVLIRCDLEGATLAEVAKELDLHVSNACRARQRGIKRLARHFEALAA